MRKKRRRAHGQQIKRKKDRQSVDIQRSVSASKKTSNRSVKQTQASKRQVLTHDEHRTAKKIHTSSKQTVQKNAKKQPKKKSLPAMLFGLIFNLLFYSFTLGLIFTAVLFAFNSNSKSSIYGYRFYTVLTNSMVPAKGQKVDGVQGFYANDVIILKDAQYDEVQVNDVITYKIGQGENYLTHRLVEKTNKVGNKEGDYLITRGDANKTDDPPVEASRLIGKVLFVIPKMGYILTFVRANIWVCLVFVLGLFGSLLVLKIYFFGSD